MSIYNDTTDYVTASQTARDLSPEAELTPNELAQVRRQMDSLRLTNEKYLRAHPELRKMIQDFLVHAFEKKPDVEHLIPFAVDYFCVQKKHYPTGNVQSTTNASNSTDGDGST